MVGADKSTELWRDSNWEILLRWGRNSIGRAVASKPRGLQFESSHQQIL